MFGKWVTVNLGEGIKCEVFVACVPSTPDDVLQERAVAQLSSRLTMRAADVKPRTAQDEFDELSDLLSANHAKLQKALRG